MEGTSLQFECDSSAQNRYCDSNKEVEVIGSLISPIVQASTESHDTFAQNRVFLTNEEVFMDSSISPIVQASTESHDNSAQNSVSLGNEMDTKLNLEPFIGQNFKSLDEVFYFYNCYALHTGFGIRKASSSKSQATGKKIWKRFECDKAGFKNSKTDEVQKKRDSRVGCLAKIDVRINKEGQWAITSFVKDHNHTLDTPRGAKRHRSHNKAHKQPIVQELMDQLYSSGIGPSKIAKVLSSNVACASINTQNVIDHLRIGRKNNVGQEGVLVAQYLHEQTVKDKGFYYALELSQEGVLRSLFWVDSRARSDFSIFGDVIVFDVTYKTNVFSMPFAPFTGVNHHRQSTLFGCALLADETEETFIWLFNHWLECMYDKAPNVIITDMDCAIYNAIKKVFPNTRHRFCSWHIGKHLVEHIHAMRNPNSEFAKDYKIWLNSKYVTTSENRWNELVEKYHIDSTSWLTKMWEHRSHWVPAFLKDVFVAGMSSSSRSESINAFFDGFVTSKTHLLEFVKQYECALTTRRKAELQADFKTMNTNANLHSKSSLEASVAKQYTTCMFKLFQEQFNSSLICWSDKICKNESITTYRVGLPNEDKQNWCTVVYKDYVEIDATCDCALFETDGYLCKHIICIMLKKRVLEIPQKFVLKRWTIGARNIANIEASTFPKQDHDVTPQMKLNLLTLATQVVDLSSNNIDSYMDLQTMLARRKEVLESTSIHIEDDTHSITNTTSYQFPNLTIRDPISIRTKGRPKAASRVSSGLEESQINIKKRTCGNCGEKGHYSTTCPKRENAVASGVSSETPQMGMKAMPPSVQVAAAERSPACVAPDNRCP